MNDPIGKVIKSYEVEDLIGTGGFGAVYRAKQAVVEREVAIKIIWPAFANHPNFIRRFEAEAQLVAGLEHPYIVPLYDYWRDPDGAYIVMRLLRGGHLRGLIADKDWTLQDIDRLLNQVGSALALAHRYGVVHRDIKPENILMDEEQNGYLADFGIAQILSNTKESDDEFSGMGSPAYAAPEQLSGSTTSPQSDIFSLGIIIYELLTGQHPFPELENLTLTEVIEMRTARPVPSALALRGDLPPTLDEVIQRATALDPRQRYPDALSLSRAYTNAIGQNKRSTTSFSLATSDDLIPNPYKGLRAFQEKDAPNFFGREALVHRLVDRLKEDNQYARFLAVVGPSGSGKSSVVKAGLLPALRQGALPGSDNWFFDEMVPGNQPFQEIENTLIGVAANAPSAEMLSRLRTDKDGLLEAVHACLPQDEESELFIFIDQFEEVFTLVESEDEINRFLDSLYVAVTAPKSRLRLVITIRADFYDRPLLQPRLSNLVRERTEVVVPLSEVELERVIVEPARRVGVQFDSGLIAAIIAEVKEQPGALPLLQYSLSELFERRESTLITPQAYKELGGVRGSLARRADELYDNMDSEQREATRQLFLRLITLGEGTEDTRRRALLSEITSLRDVNIDGERTTMQQVVDALGKARLLTFDRDPITRSPTVEVTHEAIIREWKKLREWLDESRNDVRMQRKLSTLALEWQQENRDPSLLMQGIRLEQFEEWKATTNLVLTQQENSYLQTSIDERVRREEEERAREARERMLERRGIIRLRILFGVVLLAFILTLGLLVVAFNASELASRSAEASNRLALAANASRALGDGDVDLAIALAMAATTSTDEPEPDVLRTLGEVALANGTRNVLSGHSAGILDVDISPNGQRIASGSYDSTVKLWDAVSGELIHNMTAHGGDVASVSFSPDGNTLISSASDFTAILWDVATGQEIRRFRGHTSPVRSVTFNTDGTALFTGSRGPAGGRPRIIHWDVATGEQLMTYEPVNGAVQTIAVDPNDRTFLAGSRAGELLQLNIETGEIVRRLVGHTTAVEDVSFSPDGTRAVSCSGDGTIIIWDMQTGDIIHQLQSTGADARSVAFTPDGQRILSGAGNGDLQIWDVASGSEINQIQAHADGIEGVAISSDGLLAVSGALDNNVRIWNIGTPGLAAELPANARGRRITGANFGADEDIVYFSDVDGNLRAWNIRTQEQEVVVSFANPIRTLDVNDDGTRALVGERDEATGESIILYVDLVTGETIRTLIGHANDVVDVTFFKGRNLAASSDQSGLVILWNLENGEERRRFEGHEGTVHSIAVSPDETTLITTSSDSTAILWDIETGRALRTFSGHTGAVYSAAISPDGTTLATGSRDTFIILWQIETGTEINRLIADADTVWSVAFSPDGTNLMSGTANGSLILWDWSANTIIQQFDTGDRAIFTLDYSPSGQRVASGQQDGSVMVWNTFEPDELIEWTRNNRYIRDFTCVERDQYRLPPCDNI